MSEKSKRTVTDVLNDPNTYIKLKAYSVSLVAKMMPRRMGGTPSDITQQTMLIAFKKRGGIRGKSQGELINWLKITLLNIVRMDIRKEARIRRLSTSGEKTIATEMNHNISKLHILSELDKLTEIQRAIVVLKYEGCTIEETSLKLELNKEQVKHQIRLIRRVLGGADD